MWYRVRRRQERSRWSVVGDTMLGTFALGLLLGLIIGILTGLWLEDNKWLWYTQNMQITNLAKTHY